MSHSINSFSELNTDAHPVNTKPTVMTDAVNATLTTRGENQLILQNLGENTARPHIAKREAENKIFYFSIFFYSFYILKKKRSKLTNTVNLL